MATESISVRETFLPNGKQRAQYTRTIQRDVRRQEFLRLALLGLSTKEIASKMGISRITCYEYMKEPEVHNAIKARNAEIWEKLDNEVNNRAMSLVQRIEEMSSTALDRIEALMDSENDGVALKAAVTVLDRNPETSTHHKVDSTNKTLVIDAAMLKLAASAALEIESPR